MMRARDDGGETLIEVLFTIVIVSLTFTSLFTSLATTGKAGNVQRISVQADVVMRNYAEAIKSATQTCTAGVAYTIPSYPTPPSGYVPSGATPTTCPSPAGTTQVLTLSVTVPLGPPVTMQITVMTP
jgi:type II secretory pathway pseudopilin PulG